MLLVECISKPQTSRNILIIQKLTIQGCFSYVPMIYEDERGKFFEWFQDVTLLENTGLEFKLAQANCSISRRGVLRGIHFTNTSPGQSKWVTVFSGTAMDVLVDLRKDSPTFMKWESILLEADKPKMIFIPWGVGHAFLSMEDETVFAYLCDKRYDPKNEFDLNAFDNQLQISWPSNIRFIQSDKDQKAPFLSDILDLLPNLQCQ